ncbi:hypothetical protein [Gordonia paraffinivorans]|uniref:hypothetical protein n=1 Tax=Gordonia paraffinivorans TaxID=175628 RepID=UPI00215A12B9|nr:hypothetical protein [Gordonia paraffinivorans]
MNPDRQRRFLEWETAHARLDDSWVQMYCAGARFPTGKTIVPGRPSAEALSTLDGGKAVTTIFAPHSRAHDPVHVATCIRAELPDSRIIMLRNGSHHTVR